MLDKDIILSAMERTALGFCRLKGMNDASGNACRIAGISIQFEDWDWEVGVGLYGFFRQAEYFGDEGMIKALEDWYDGKIDAGLPRRQVNSTAPMLALACLYERHPQSHWKDVIYEWADWMYSKHPRTEDGGCQHTVRERPNTGQLWDDTLFMASLFLARAGKLFNRQDWVDDALYQFQVHAKYLADKDTGLWFHGWTFEGRHHFGKARWGRGNCWVTVAIPEILGIVPDMSATIRADLTGMFLDQVNALARLQAKNGMWHTLLDDNTSPQETSATAGFAYGLMLGQQTNLIGTEFDAIIEKAILAVKDRVDSDGIVAEVSDGTPMGPDLDFYRNIPNVPAPYGQALASLMFLETIETGMGLAEVGNG